MKQNITKTDLEQLSEKGKEKLREWWKPEDTDLYFDSDIHQWGCDFDGALQFDYESKKVMGNPDDGWGVVYPALSIGQMIEFLDEQDHRLILSKANGSVWLVAFSNRPTRDEHPSGAELCDALWEAVKEVIEANSLSVEENK